MKGLGFHVPGGFTQNVWARSDTTRTDATSVGGSWGKDTIYIGGLVWPMGGRHNLYRCLMVCVGWLIENATYTVSLGWVDPEKAVFDRSVIRTLGSGRFSAKTTESFFYDISLGRENRVSIIAYPRASFIKLSQSICVWRR